MFCSSLELVTVSSKNIFLEICFCFDFLKKNTDRKKILKILVKYRTVKEVLIKKRKSEVVRLVKA